MTFVNDTFSLILHNNMGMKYAVDPFTIGTFFTKGTFHNGYICRPPTHTSGHFTLESPPFCGGGGGGVLVTVTYQNAYHIRVYRRATFSLFIKLGVPQRQEAGWTLLSLKAYIILNSTYKRGAMITCQQPFTICRHCGMLLLTVYTL